MIIIMFMACAREWEIKFWWVCMTAVGAVQMRAVLMAVVHLSNVAERRWRDAFLSSEHV